MGYDLHDGQEDDEDDEHDDQVHPPEAFAMAFPGWALAAIVLDDVDLFFRVHFVEGWRAPGRAEWRRFSFGGAKRRLQWQRSVRSTASPMLRYITPEAKRTGRLGEGGSGDWYTRREGRHLSKTGAKGGKEGTKPGFGRVGLYRIGYGVDVLHSLASRWE